MVQIWVFEERYLVCLVSRDRKRDAEILGIVTDTEVLDEKQSPSSPLYLSRRKKRKKKKKSVIPAPRYPRVCRRESSGLLEYVRLSSR